MIDDKILDQVIPVPDLTELEDQRIQELSDAGFTITNFHSGGVFHTLLMIVLRIQIELLELCRTVLNQMFVSHASGAWLDLKMSDYSKTRKLAQKTQGVVTVSPDRHGRRGGQDPKGAYLQEHQGYQRRRVALWPCRRSPSRRGRSPWRSQWRPR